MKHINYLFLVFLTCLLLSTTGFGENNKADIVVRDLDPASDTVNAVVSVSNAGPGKIDVKVTDVKNGGLLSTGLSAKPVNLWVMADASQLCQTYKVDKYLDAMLTEVKKQMHPRSILSVVSFTSSTLEFLVKNKELGEADSLALKCDPRLVSTSYEKPLTRLLENYKENSLPTTAWIFTSGNISLSDDMLKQLEKNNVNLHVVLYNAIMEADLRPMIAQINQRLGKERVQLSVLNPTPNMLPERWYQVAFAAPKTKRWNSVSVEFSAVQDGKEIAKELSSVTLPEGGSGTFYERIGRYLMLVGFIALLGYATFRLIQYYRPRFCSSCQKRMRHTDAACVFCQSEVQGYLVGNFNRFDRRKVGKKDVLPLVAPTTEVGAGRKNALRLVKPIGKRALPYLRIERELTTMGHVAFRCVPTGAEPVKINEVLVQAPRYLSPGDLLEVGGVAMTFIYGSKKHA